MVKPTTLKLIKAWLLVGTLDILCAFGFYFIKTGSKNVEVVLKFVATGVFGKSAMTGGADMIIAGLIFHYCIAFAFTCFFFFLYTKLSLISSHPILAGIIYGIAVWAVMNLIVVPLSHVPARPFDPINAIINAAILVLCIGMPLAFIAKAKN
jgi:hypothetical protein